MTRPIKVLQSFYRKTRDGEVVPIFRHFELPDARGLLFCDNDEENVMHSGFVGRKHRTRLWHCAKMGDYYWRMCT